MNDEWRFTNDGIAALSHFKIGHSTKDSRQAVRQKTHDRPFDKRLTTGRSTKDSRQAIRQKTHDRPFDKRLTTGRMQYSVFDVGRSMFNVHWLLLRSDRSLSRPEALVKPEPRTFCRRGCILLLKIWDYYETDTRQAALPIAS